MDAPFTRGELMHLAEEILTLDCTASSLVHAEKMVDVKENEYSRSFFEAATRIREMLSTGSSLTAAVEAVAGYVPSVENIEFKLIWWQGDVVTVTKRELTSIAAIIAEYDVPSPDRSLARRIACTKKASNKEWRLFALRYVDYKSRISKFDVLLWDFCSDIDRAQRELAALKPWIKKARPDGDCYNVERPVMPPWKDPEFWDADLDEWGYGDDFSPSLATLPSTDIVTSTQPATECNPDYNDEYEVATVDGDTDSVVDYTLVEEEDYEVTTMDPDVFEDEELYAAQDIEKKRLLADAVNLPKLQITNHLSARTLRNFPQIASKYTALTAEGEEQRAADSAMLAEAMSYSSFKEELKACEEDMKRDPDGKLLARALSRLFAEQEKIEELEMAAHNKSVPLLSTVTHSSTDLAVPSSVLPLASGSDDAGPSHVLPTLPGSDVAGSSHTISKALGPTVIGSDLASTSTTLPPTVFLPEHLDANAYSQLVDPLVSEEAWPPLSNNKTAPSVQQKAPSTSQNVQLEKNVWVEKNKARRNFMNAGIGGKLPHIKPTATEFYVDVTKAHTIQDIWGFSLLGQYVGHNPGHYLINSMIKSWGVRVKYKLEEGWFIFKFESENDREKVLIGGPYLIHGRPMLLKNIPDKFAFNRKDLALVPLWVRIYGLASRFWTPQILGGIASYVGCPMYMDPVTDSRKRNAYARVLVEINLAEPVTKTVPIKFSDGDTIEVHFLVENQPKFCNSCCSYGHGISDCQFIATKPTIAAKKQIQKPAVNHPENVQNSSINSLRYKPTTDANKKPDVDTDSLKLSTDVPLHNVRSKIQKQHDKQATTTAGKPDVHTDLDLANQFAVLNEDAEHISLSQEEVSKKLDINSTEGVAIQPVIHTEMELVNQSAALNEAPEHSSLSHDKQSAQPTVFNSVGVSAPVTELLDGGQLQSTTQGFIQKETTGQINKKMIHSTPTSKMTLPDSGQSDGPSTRSKKKQIKT